MIHFMSCEKYPSPARENPVVNCVTSSKGSLGTPCASETAPKPSNNRKKNDTDARACCGCMNLFLRPSDDLSSGKKATIDCLAYAGHIEWCDREIGKDLKAELEHHMHRLLTVVEAGGARGLRLIEEGKRLCKRVKQFVQ